MSGWRRSPSSRPPEAPERGHPSLLSLLRRHLTPRVVAAVTIWRLEAWLAAPLPFLLVASLGRWPGALAMAGVMGALCALFLLLLDGEEVLATLHRWAAEREWGRPLLAGPERPWLVWLLAVPLCLLWFGPFWRAVVLLLLRLGRPLSYLIGVGGALPHALLWTGLVVGGVWEGLLWPFLKGLL